ncbi:disks large-associated protein 3 isoform X3 [Pantherophis guttatus]|uniref:Disks large-associated protein 3 isoform X3 n=1 Tax=Pantherophis guttatus TaxID=94885 RepID=A0A6P9BDD9_PANGU|nr:disks large-associated protein 3 isoform X3 [Pantherophis guttatus]
MKSYHGDRNQSREHPCHCIPEACDQPMEYIHHSQESRQPYLLSPSEPYSLDHYCSSRSSADPPLSLTEPLSAASSSSTFPRMHHTPQQYDSCDECMAAAHPSGKINRLPPTLLDQFEKQLPLHHDGFHTLQYQRASSTEQPRSESPSRIRHLVHSVQKLFAKSHSLEAPSKREYNGTKMEGRGTEGGYHHHHPHHHRQSRHGKRSKSKDRKMDSSSSSSRHRNKMMGWWSSDDNLDSDSSYMVSGRQHAVDQSTQYCVDTPESAFRDLTLKGLKSGGGEGKCLACAGMSMSLDGQTLKRSSWHTMTVSQAREAYPSSGGGPEKALMLQEAKAKDRSYHYLQVPQDDWGGYPTSGKDGEIPCRRMRSGSYIKAMGDDDSGDSDTSTKVSPKEVARREAYRRSSSVDQARTNCCTPPRIRPRGQGYGRSFTTGQINDELNHQFEAVCESVFGEVESQAVEALDLPGCFRMRSHSYLRAIQAGCSQDDDCLSLFTMATTTHQPGQPLTSSILKPSTSFSYRKAPPALPSGIKAKPLIAVTAQSSTESTHDSFLPREINRSSSWAKEATKHCNSSESLESTKITAMSLDLPSVQPRTSPKPSTLIIRTIPGREELRSLARQRKWRPSIGVQVETISDSDTESRSCREFHSIGVQVEEDKRRARFKRSNSVTAGVQADLELEGLAGLAVATEDKALQFGRSFQRHSSEPESTRQYSVYKTVHTQGQWAYREDYQMQYDTVEVPRQESWMDRGSRSLPDSGRASPCHRDGEWFIKLLQAEVEKMEGWCQQMELEAEDYDLPEEILEKIRSAVGSAQLLMSQKVQQFYRLCQQNMDPNAFPIPTFQDLAGFWDLLQLSIEDVSMKFAELQQLKSNGWKPIEAKQEEKKVPPPIPKKPPRSRLHPVKDRSLDSVDRQRQEARKRLLAAKRAASFRQSSATESADSIEIYIPEAQTRL